MPGDRSVRTLIAALLFILALFIGMNYLVERRPLLDWWLPGLLFVGGLVAALPVRAPRVRSQPSGTVPVQLSGYTTREYTFGPRDAAPALAAAGPEQPGEVNVREPRDEAESQDDLPPASLPDTGRATPVDTPVPDDAPPNPINPPPARDTSTGPTEDEQVLDDLDTAGTFAPPATAGAALNPPTETDARGDVVQHISGVQTDDPARPGMPLTPQTEPETPERTPAQRLEEDKVLLQPQDTAENEFQSGEHVAHNQPTESAPVVTQTTGEGMGPGVEPMEPEKKEVLDTTAAPHQPTSQSVIDPTRPDVADAVLSDTHTPEVAEGIAPSQTVTAEPVTGAGQDDLTVINGIGPKMQTALRTAGIDSFTKLSMATDEALRAAVEAGGMRLAPSLSTWREQAGFLARGDRAGFEALLRAQRHLPDGE